MTILRRTKIIATLGPSTDSYELLKGIIDAGVDIVRTNFSHGNIADHENRVRMVRTIASESGKETAILADLQGPKIRISCFKNKRVELKQGAKFILDANLASNAGDENKVGIDYKELPQDVKTADVLLLDDGRIELQVKQVSGREIICEVKVGGELSNNKGINRRGGGLSAGPLTEKDRSDLKIAAQLGVDYVAVSFPRSAADILEVKQLLQDLNSHAGVIAKIERTEALEALDDIINASDAVMVARGDLGVEIGDAELPGVQKHIIHQARSLNKAVITATQMMESMIINTIPTRAEVFDVANAVLDGTDAVMLSAETATGAHPDKVVSAMARICISAERQPRALISRHRVEMRFNRVDEAIAMAAMYTANHLDIKAIVCLTESGSTPLWMSRIRSGIPIFGFTRNVVTQRRMLLFRGVYPVYFDVTSFPPSDVHRQAVSVLQNRGTVSSGDKVIITHGDLLGTHGGTNLLKIVEVGQVV
jgi:pyruvate kinase